MKDKGLARARRQSDQPQRHPNDSRWVSLRDSLGHTLLKESRPSLRLPGSVFGPSFLSGLCMEQPSHPDMSPWPCGACSDLYSM